MLVAVCDETAPNEKRQLMANPDIGIDLTNKIPLPGNLSAVAPGWERWQEAANCRNDKVNHEFIENCRSDPNLRPFIEAILGNSPFLSHTLINDFDITRKVIELGPDSAFSEIIETVSDAALIKETRQTLMKVLRIARRRCAFSVAIADITGQWQLNKIIEALSLFAERVINTVTNHLLHHAAVAGELDLPYPSQPTLESGLIVLGMGKLGAEELNYSSDVDLIFLFDDEKSNYTGKQTAQEFFNRLARNFVKIIEERNADGYVFRTDLRLRPDPGSTPPVLSTLAAETYYETTGQNWERAAMLKARPISGDIDAGIRFLDYLRPFIWRQSLDFDAIEDISSIKRQINSRRGHNKILVGGHNVKLGRGGIREIELYAQTQQLIWGGRNANLRVPKTCKALSLLASAGHFTSKVSDELIKAYQFLRGVEHRLQMVDDQQTHEVPSDIVKLEAFSKFMGFENTDNFSRALTKHLRIVEKHYVALFEESPDLSGPGSLVFTGGEDHPETLQTLESLGYRDPSMVSSIVRTWHHGRYRATRSTRSKELLTKLMPGLINAFSKTGNPDTAILGFDGFLKGLPAGVQLLSLFYSNPGLLKLLAEIMGSAPKIADTLRRYPNLFDAVLTADFFEPLPNASTIQSELELDIQRKAQDFQDTLGIVRRQVNDRLFRVSVHIIGQHMKADSSGPSIANIADAAINTLCPAVKKEFISTHGTIEGGDMAVVALGKLGARDMTVGSDLDLLFIYNHEGDQSDGEKPLSPIPYFTRLGQRYISALTAPTAEGTLYQVDMRLRPSGNSAPLASELTSFIQYHENNAWTWERMALTRARVIYSGRDLRRKTEEVIQSILMMPQNPDKLLKDVAAMRVRLLHGRKIFGPWDIKNIRGGLVDIEFITQYLQLRYSRENPNILTTDPEQALIELRNHEILNQTTANQLIKSLKLWRNIQGLARLTVGEKFDYRTATNGNSTMLLAACRAKSIEDLRQKVTNRSACVLKIYQRIIEKPASKI